MGIAPISNACKACVLLMNYTGKSTDGIKPTSIGHEPIVLIILLYRQLYIIVKPLSQFTSYAPVQNYQYH
jgi:hypothetical protein